MEPFQTPQEQFWASSFGDEYSKRNTGEQIVASNTALFAKILSRAGSISSVIEFGANIGLNLQALKKLLPDASMAAVEINEYALAQISKLPGVKEIYGESLLRFSYGKTYDLVLIKGVLIHVGPEALDQAYSVLYQSSCRYICLVEYYNPVPVMVPYRGHREMLFKRDFAGEMLDRYSDLKLVDYGFQYHRDSNFPQDDLTWFLLEKQN